MNTEPETVDSQFAWADERWYCGIPTECCRYCLRPVLFSPPSLGLEVCSCGSIPTETNSLIRVEPATRNRGFSKTSADNTK